MATIINARFRTLYEEEAAIAEPLHRMGPRYAVLLGQEVGGTWRYLGSAVDNENRPNCAYVLERDNGARLYISADRHSQKVTASTMWILVPDGSEHGRRTPIRDFVPRQYVNGGLVPGPKLEAAVSLARYVGEAEACARRFARDVAKPLAELWPDIEARIAETVAGLSERDAVAARLAARFGGQVRRHDTRCSVYFGDGLPGVMVDHGGSIRFDYTPSLSERAAVALFEAMRAEAADKRARKGEAVP